MDGNQQQVITWIKSGCNYDDGVLLYKRIGRNESLKLLFHGKRHKYARKLMYELCKSAGIDWNKLSLDKPVEKAAPQIVKTDPKGSTVYPSREYNAPKLASNISTYPPIVRRVIMEYGELFQDRSRLHRLMVGLGDSNAEAVKQKRKEFFDLVKASSIRLEQLYEARDSYEKKGLLPTEEELWPKKKQAAELPEDIDELKKLKKNLQTNRVKNQNLLDYQTKTKQSKMDPMPAGPRRMKLENRIKAITKKIEEIDYKLNKVEE